MVHGRLEEQDGALDRMSSNGLTTLLTGSIIRPPITTLQGLFNGQEYVPQDTNGGGREIRANIWLVWYDQTELAAARAIR